MSPERLSTIEVQETEHLLRGYILATSSGGAKKAGLKAGDMILAINGVPITSHGQLASMRAKSPEQNVEVAYCRLGSSGPSELMTVVIVPERQIESEPYRLGFGYSYKTVAVSRSESGQSLYSEVISDELIVDESNQGSKGKIELRVDLYESKSASGNGFRIRQVMLRGSSGVADMLSYAPSGLEFYYRPKLAQKALGSHYPGLGMIEVASLRTPHDIQVLAHEIGHSYQVGAFFEALLDFYALAKTFEGSNTWDSDGNVTLSFQRMMETFLKPDAVAKMFPKGFSDWLSQFDLKMNEFRNSQGAVVESLRRLNRDLGLARFNDECEHICEVVLDGLESMGFSFRDADSRPLSQEQADWFRGRVASFGLVEINAELMDSITRQNLLPKRIRDCMVLDSPSIESSGAAWELIDVLREGMLPIPLVTLPESDTLSSTVVWFLSDRRSLDKGYVFATRATGRPIDFVRFADEGPALIARHREVEHSLERVREEVLRMKIGSSNIEVKSLLAFPRWYAERDAERRMYGIIKDVGLKTGIPLTRIAARPFRHLRPEQLSTIEDPNIFAMFSPEDRAILERAHASHMAQQPQKAGDTVRSHMDALGFDREQYIEIMRAFKATLPDELKKSLSDAF